MAMVMKYEIDLNAELTQLIIKSISQSPQDVAQIIYAMYKDQYICTSIVNNIWYQLINGQWVLNRGSISLMRRCGNEVLNEYLRVIAYYNQEAYCQYNDEEKDTILHLCGSLMKMTYKLREIGFRGKILAQARFLFHAQLPHDV
jgi:hypothetical protein